MQQVAWLLSLALMLLVAMGFGFVALRSGRRADDYTPLQVRAYRIRTKLFWALVLVLGPAMVYTLLDLPYAAGHAHASPSGAPALAIDAKGYQWRWELSRNEDRTRTLAEEIALLRAELGLPTDRGDQAPSAPGTEASTVVEPVEVADATDG